jgi:hypothetical protein
MLPSIRLCRRRLDPELPYLKRESMALLNQPYNTEQEALRSITSGLDKFYSQYYPAIYASKQDGVKAATTEVSRIFSTYFFPEMKTNWSSHPNNIGHFYFSGCFRCHDGEHVSNDGKVIRNDCTICHTVIYDSANPAASVKLGRFSTLWTWVWSSRLQVRIMSQAGPTVSASD